MLKIILLSCVMLTGCASITPMLKNWHPANRALLDANNTCVLIDYLQTESALDQPKKFREANPLFGSNPSDEKLATITAVRLGMNYGAGMIFENEGHRFAWYMGSLIPCTAAIIHNHHIGVRIEF